MALPVFPSKAISPSAEEKAAIARVTQHADAYGLTVHIATAAPIQAMELATANLERKLSKATRNPLSNKGWAKPMLRKIAIKITYLNTIFISVVIECEL